MSDEARNLWLELSEAKDRIEALERALEPFAKAADGLGEMWADSCRVCQHVNVAPILTFGDLRLARSTPHPGRGE